MNIQRTMALLSLGALAATGVFAANDRARSGQPSQGQIQQPAEQAKEGTDQTQAAAPVTPEESQVLSTIHRVNQSEIKMGEMALDKAQSQGVKDYAQRLIDDHKATDEQVQNLAEQRNYAIPKDKDQLSANREKRMMTKLEKMEGAAFDREFTKSMAEEHKLAATALEASQPKLSGAVGQLLAQVIPLIREHQMMAQKLNVQLQGSATKG